MSDSKQAVLIKKFPTGFSKYLCRTCRQLRSVESNGDEISVQCGTKLVAPVAKKQVGRHVDCPHSQEGKVNNGVLNGVELKKLAQFARHQKNKVSKGVISIETLQVRICAYETRLYREMTRN